MEIETKNLVFITKARKDENAKKKLKFRDFHISCFRDCFLTVIGSFHNNRVKESKYDGNIL